jgi:hypothetical protein
VLFDFHGDDIVARGDGVCDVEVESSKSAFVFSHQFAIDIDISDLEGRLKFQHDSLGGLPVRLNIQMPAVPADSHVPEDPLLERIVGGVKDMGQVHLAPRAVVETGGFRARRVLL